MECKINLPKAGEILAETDEYKLVVFDETVREDYMRTSEENSIIKNMYRRQEFRDMMWQDCFEEGAFYCAIRTQDDGRYVGYIAIKNTNRELWELAMELLPEEHCKGVGGKALPLFLDGICRITGDKVFRSRVDSDNYVSQALMKKIGAKPNGVSEFMLHGDMLEQFENENIQLIDEKLKAVAEEFNVAARDLLGHVLEYLIEWPQAKK